MTAIIKKVMVAVATVAVCWGCNGGESVSTAEGLPAAVGAGGDSLSLRVAVMPTMDCLPAYVASRCGLFERESLSVELVPFTAQMDCDTAVAGGSVHALFTDLVRAERLVRQGTPLRHASATALGWQLLTAKTARIRKLPQMDDKLMAMTRHSATAMLADHLVDSAGLAPERVFRIQVNDVLVRLNMMETGTIDAVLLPEPQATVARNLGCAMLYDSSADSLALGVLAFSEAALADSLRQRQMEAFTRACDAAVDSINTKGLLHYRSLIADVCHVTEATVDSMAAQHPPLFAPSRPPRDRDMAKARKWLR